MIEFLFTKFKKIHSWFWGSCLKTRNISGKPMQRWCHYHNNPFRPLPFCWVKKSLLLKHPAAHGLTFLLKVHLNGGNFLFISAHRYYAETPHEVNILTSFLKRIWVQLSESFSELKIGWFLWLLDQKIVLTLFVNFYRAKIGAQLDTDIQGYLMLPMNAFNW